MSSGTPSSGSRPADYLRLGYYERWLRAIETLLAEKGLLPPEEAG